MMKKNILFVFLMLATVAMADKKQVAIISVNDMHANVQKMPVLADIVDSIRAIYPNLLVLSAGDNRTGSPINDQYRIPAYPMVAMMNAIGFDASALGNHEFDSGVEGLGRLINLAHFRHLCANIEDPQEHGLNVLPYQFFDMDGIRVGVLSVVQLSDRGTPSVHPNKIVGLEFKDEKETIAKYKWMRDECDLNILLDHSGYPAEKEFCEEFPYYDLIIGGHTHTKVDGERINGVLLSQTEWQLKYVCLTVVTFDDKKIVSKEAKLIDVNKHQGRSEVLDNMLTLFNENPYFKTVLATNEVELNDVEEVACLMGDSHVAESGADLAILNFGAVRDSHLDQGPIRILDVFRIDPFGNEAAVYTLTGAEVVKLIEVSRQKGRNRAPFVSGMTYEMTVDKADTAKIKNTKVFLSNGKPIDKKKQYKVVLNSYVASIGLDPDKSEDYTCGTTPELLIEYLKKVSTVNYKGKVRRKIIRK